MGQEAMATKVEDILRDIPSEEHRQALVEFHQQMSTTVSASAPSFAGRFVADLSTFLGKDFTIDEQLSLYVLFLKHAIYMIVCQALPVFLHVVKSKDLDFIRQLSHYLPIITPDELPRAKLDPRN